MHSVVLYLGICTHPPLLLFPALGQLTLRRAYANPPTAYNARTF